MKYGIFQVLQAQDIARVRAFLDFWRGRSAHRMRLHRAWLVMTRPNQNHDYACGTNPITGVGLGTGRDGIYGYNNFTWMPSWFIAILNTLAATLNKDGPLA